MLYQLPNGKVIHLSVEDYLSLSDEDLHTIANSGYGEYAPHYMFYGKQEREKKVVKEEVDEDEDLGLDYTPESEETDTRGPIDLNNLPDEDMS